MSCREVVWYFNNFSIYVFFSDLNKIKYLYENDINKEEDMIYNMMCSVGNINMKNHTEVTLLLISSCLSKSMQLQSLPFKPFLTESSEWPEQVD